MKKFSMIALVLFASLVLCVVAAFAQPTDIGEFCFRADTSGTDYDYTLQVTQMGTDNHFALNGNVYPHVDEGIILLNPLFEPVHGVAEIRGTTVYMTLHKSSAFKSVLSPGDDFILSDTVYVEMPAATLTGGTFKQIRQSHNITQDTNSTFYVSGTFGLCPPEFIPFPGPMIPGPIMP